MKRWIHSAEDAEFGERQLKQIEEGRELGLDVRLYADPKFDYMQMHEIRNGVESGVCTNRSSLEKSTELTISRDKNYFEQSAPLSDKWFEWAFGDDEGDYDVTDEMIIEKLEDNGYTVVDTLKEACDIYWNDADGDIEQALGALDVDFGNSVGVIPLVDLGYPEDQDTFLEYCQIYHPEEYQAYIDENGE